MELGLRRTEIRLVKPAPGRVSLAAPVGAIRKPFPQDFDPESDVFMAFQGSDPQTYKIDAFGGVLLGAYVLKTRDMRSPAWETVLHQDILRLDLLPDRDPPSH